MIAHDAGAKKLSLKGLQISDARFNTSDKYAHFFKDSFTVKPGQADPSKFIIRKLSPLAVVDFRSISTFENLKLFLKNNLRILEERYIDI